MDTMGTLITRLITLSLMLIFLQACAFEHGPELRVTIINNSKSDVLVDEYFCCDSNQIIRDINWYCKSRLDTTSYPRVIKHGRSTVMNTRMKASESLLVVNIDSIKVNCKSLGKAPIKNWVQILVQDVAIKNKRCNFVIK